ncbi:MAG: thioredoxin family protein [Phaeodactylibacter sp.]|nr:thioredoxin family protein [Phaeodactylibacter sp.]MCB9299637.1 thioredoxin family protein [Lewinellaceae bacterium]HQU59086.1 thioredoxin family protein [Saprospiraceae bacterium]
MKNLTFLAALLLPLSLFSTPPQNVIFIDASLPEARQQAAREGKLLFIHFAAGWCMPCQWMEQNTFTDPILASYLEDTYIALRADVDEASGYALQKQFKVKVLPTILTFNTRGQLLGRHEGAMEAEALLEQLHAYDQSENRMPSSSEPEEAGLLSSPRPILQLSRPALLPDVPAARPASLPFPTTTSAPAVATSYASRQQHTFFAIQAGLFSSYENAVRESAKLEKSTKGPVRLAPDSSSGQTIYRIFLGQFGQREDARIYLKELEARGIDGFIKEIGD